MPKAGYEYMLKNLKKHGGMSLKTFDKLAKRAQEEGENFLDANECRKLLAYINSEEFLEGRTKDKKFDNAKHFLEAMQEAYAEYATRTRSQTSTSSLYKQQQTSASWLGGGKIAHALFTDKNRPKQLEILEECRERMKKGQMTPMQYYGAIVFLQDSIGKTRYDSRLQGVLKDLSNDLMNKQPSLSSVPRDQAKEQFRVFALANPSMLKENPILKEVRAGMGVEKVASEAVNIDRFATVERQEKVADLIERYSKQNAINDEYNKSRSRTSRVFQDKSRAGQLQELELVMKHLEAANIPKDKKVLM